MASVNPIHPWNGYAFSRRYNGVCYATKMEYVMLKQAFAFDMYNNMISFEDLYMCCNQGDRRNTETT